MLVRQSSLRGRQVSQPSTPRSWTVDRVISGLPKLDWLSQREMLAALSGQRDELCRELRLALQTCSGPAQRNAAVILLKLQDPAGRDVFLAALSGSDAAAARTGLETLRDILPHDTRYEDKYRL